MSDSTRSTASRSNEKADKPIGRMVEDRWIAGNSSTVEPQVFPAAWRPLTIGDGTMRTTVRNVHARLFDQWSDESGLVDMPKVACD
jgi:hypothetical protein